MDNITSYIVALVMLIIGVTIFKKVASCLFRTIITLVLVAIFGYLYYTFFRQ